MLMYTRFLKLYKNSIMWDLPRLKWSSEIMVVTVIPYYFLLYYDYVDQLSSRDREKERSNHNMTPEATDSFTNSHSPHKASIEKPGHVRGHLHKV